MADIINDGQIAQVEVGKLEHHPRNVQDGDVGAIYQSIEANGFYGALVVQRSSGYVLVGNHRLRAAKEAGIKKVPVIYVDVDDERALRIMLADNRTAALATQDEVLLSEILKELHAGGGLDGTGYDGDDLDALLKKLDDHPYGDQEANAPVDVWGVIVDCPNERKQVEALEMLTSAGFACRAVAA